MNTKIIGIVILVVAIGGASAYFITKNDPVETNSFSTQPISQNEKISLVINTINPPQSIDDLEDAYKVASTSGSIGAKLNLKKEILIGVLLIL